MVCGVRANFKQIDYSAQFNKYEKLFNYITYL